MTEPERLEEIARLEAMLSASEQAGSGYKDRVAAIKARLNELNSQRS
jgi:hypothetical protein